MRDTKPSYNLKVIVRETGIKPDTLRAWERRYNLPAPQRTEGGHRLYSQRDVAMIKWLLARQAEGLSISHAVQLWRDMEATGRDPLLATATPQPVEEVASATAAADLATLREAWLRACLEFDEAVAEQQLGQALARHAPEIVCLEVMQKGLAHIGRLWYENQATVQQEHFVAAVALRRVNALLAAAPPASRSQLVYLACPPQEEHAFPLLLLALLLRYRGWPVAYFGANVPLAQMESALQATRPALVVLAAQTLPAAAETLAMARFLQAHQTRPAYGGGIFNRLPALRQQMPGYFLGETLPAAAASVTEILTAGPAMPAGTPASAAYGHMLATFDRQRRLIEGQVWQSLPAEGWSEAHLRLANRHLAQNIRAALALGDLSLVNDEIAWVKQLLSNYHIPLDFLTRYLTVYAQVAREHLDQSCRLIIEWLAAVSASEESAS
jgi:DNA-binding transcriptional MerR regulator